MALDGKLLTPGCWREYSAIRATGFQQARRNQGQGGGSALNNGGGFPTISPFASLRAGLLASIVPVLLPRPVLAAGAGWGPKKTPPSSLQRDWNVDLVKAPPAGKYPAKLSVTNTTTATCYGGTAAG